MADEEQEKQESQKEAEKNNELPQGELTQSVPIDEYAKETEQVHDKLEEFGETDLNHFISKVTSNVYGRQVVRKLLGLDADKPFLDPETHSSPQGGNGSTHSGGNITGQLDHSTYPPKVKGTTDGTKSL